MTALTKGVAREGKNIKLPAYGAETNVVIFRGAMVMVNANGFLAPCTQEAGAVFAGISRTEIDMNGEPAGSIKAQVEAVDAFYVDIAAAAQVDIGKKVYALDDNTVELVQTANSVEVGRIMEVVSATKVLVKPNEDLTK